MDGGAEGPAVTPRDLFRIYNRVVEAGGLDPMPDHWYPNQRGKLQQLDAFLQANELDAGRWIRAKHEAIKWRARLTVAKLTTATPQFIERFREWGEDLQHEGMHQEEIHREAEWDDRSGLTILGEALKRSQSRDMCATTPETSYHPASEWCKSCSAVEVCIHVGSR